MANSEFGWLIAVLHAALLILAIANMSPPDRRFADSLDRLYASGGWCSATVYAGRPFHFHYESFALKLIIIADLPALLVSSAAQLVLYSTHLLRVSLYVQSYFDGAFHMLFGSLQWLIVGCMVERRLAPGGRAARAVTAVRAHRRAIFVLILAVTVLLAPLVQRHSNSLGFRHGGISFVGPR